MVIIAFPGNCKLANDAALTLDRFTNKLTLLQDAVVFEQSRS